MIKRPQTSASGKLWMTPDSLVHSAGSLVAVLNGKMSSVALSGLTANTLYMIYFVPNVGLAYSINNNSIGPGTANWVLVGAFYSNQSSAFGSFLNISGKPTTAAISHAATLASSGGGGITFNGTVPIAPNGYWKRCGELLKYVQSWRNGTGGPASGAAGSILMPFPTNIVPSPGVASDGNFGVFVGVCHGYNATEGSVANGVYMSGANNAQYTNFASGSVYQVADIAASFGINFNLDVKISGWSDTPIMDL